MKTNTLNLIIAILGLIIMVTGFIFLQAGQAKNTVQGATATAINYQPRILKVNGSGEVHAPPDQAVVTFLVKTQSDLAAEAQTQNAKSIKGVTDFLHKMGVQQADIQVGETQILPVSGEQVTGKSQLPSTSGYLVRNEVDVFVHNLNDLAGFLDRAGQSGGYPIVDITLKTKDQSGLLDQARQAAMEDATRKAQRLASLAGATVGNVVSVEEVREDLPAPIMLDLGTFQNQFSSGSSDVVRVILQVTWTIN